MNQIYTISRNKKFVKYESAVEKAGLEVLKILRKNNILIEVCLADNRLMRRLNKEYRGKDKAANVLSFVEPSDFPHPETKARYLGEIYLNLECDPKLRIHPNLQTRYKTINSSKSTNIFVDSDKFVDWHRYLLIHGILHLLGYTHKKKSDRIKMEKKEKYVHHFFRHRNFAN